MTSTFAFLPRKLTSRPARGTHGQFTAPIQSSSLKLHSSTVSSVPSITTTHVRVDKKGNALETKTEVSKPITYSDDEYAVLVHLAASDYAVWADPDLRRALDWNAPNEDGSANSGFINLSYLLRRSAALSSVPGLDRLAEARIAKVAKSILGDTLEIRLSLSGPSSSQWDSNTHTSTSSVDRAGGYEVRRCDWETYIHDAFPNFSQQYWKERTVYFENIPIRFRSIPSMAIFAIALIKSSPDSSQQPSPQRIQSITLPPHHNDKPGDPPKSKGFAFIRFTSLSDVDYLLHRWPWRVPRERDVDDEDARQTNTIEIQEATKFGLRCLSQSQWDNLKAEYLEYKQELLDDILKSQDDDPHFDASAVESSGVEIQAPRSHPETSKAETCTHETHVDTSRIPSLSDPHPYNCLLFVRNLHTETNKTALRALFSTALTKHSAGNGSPIDYVDYNKGMDTCYLRLTMPEHAKLLASYFLDHPTTQINGQDATGSPASDSSKAIRMEIIQGRPEAIYWEKVPEKVRRTAVQKVIDLLKVTRSDEDNGRHSIVTGEMDDGPGEAAHLERGSVGRSGHLGGDVNEGPNPKRRRRRR